VTPRNCVRAAVMWERTMSESRSLILSESEMS